MVEGEKSRRMNGGCEREKRDKAEQHNTGGRQKADRERGREGERG